MNKFEGKYVLEAQKNISHDPENTEYVPCPIAEAEVFALFSDDEYLGDVAVSEMTKLLKEVK